MAPVISFIVVTLNICLLIKLSSSAVYTGGCSATPLLPDKPFVIVWNHPTFVCDNKGVQLDSELKKWGIVDNTRDRFFGQQIVLFYNLGKWPYYDSDDKPVNGGLPQLSDLQAHLTKVDADLKTNVWNTTFGGLGVIDMEYWRPLYWTNFSPKSIYQRQSRALAKQKFPDYNKAQILAEAIKEFNKAARDFISQTLQKASTKRPEGKWGYYLHPRCFDPNCNTTTIRNNDRISWLFQESSALYPSIYFKQATPQSKRATQTTHTLHEAFRVKAKYSSQDIPVMPYTKSQEGPFNMYQQMDLSLAILQPANMGSSGVVIWGSSSDLRAKNECLVLKDYINNVLGPYSKKVNNFFGNCTKQLCNGHGRCVRKDYERVYQIHLRESGRSECLLSNELLNATKISKDKDTRHKTHSDNITFERTHLKNNIKKKIRQRNRALGFVDHMRKHFTSDFQFNNRFKLSGGRKMKRDKMSIKLSKSVNHFSIKRTKDNKHDNRLSFEMRNNDPLTSSYVHSNAGPNKDPTFEPNSFPRFNANAPTPNYDFDDYICKCYPGFSGNRCENKNI